MNKIQQKMRRQEERDALQHAANVILENDQTYVTNARSLRSRMTCGIIKAAEYRTIWRWQIAQAFRRAKVPFTLSRKFMSLL